MNTENLIRALVTDGARPVIPLGRTLSRALGVGTMLAALWLFIRHPRADLVQAFSTARFVFKLAVVLALAGTSAVMLLDAARPVSPRRRRWSVLLAPLLLAGGIIVELMTVPPQAWPAELIGHHPANCLMFIPLISLAPMACLLLALRSGAPAHPALAGAVAGVLAAAVGAAVYALTCPNDSPLFIATWYSTAIAIVMATSASIGRSLLRW